MSPIDDELRAALHGRARVIVPAADPLAGVERRARRIQRNRVGAAVVGSALAVGLVAAVVPAIQTAAAPQPQTPRVATAGPTLEQRPIASPYALDPARPWEYRGADESVLGSGTFATIRREYAVKRGVPESQVTLSPLFGQLWEPAQRTEVVFLAKVGDDYRWGVAHSSESGTEWDVDEPLAEPAMALAAALPGDEVARLLVVGAPGVQIEYGHDDASEFDPMAALTDGVATTPLDGDPANDSYRLLDPSGEQVHRAPAPDSPEAAAEQRPDNLLGWPARGQADAALEERAAAAYATAKGAARSEVEYRVLLTGDTDAGTKYTVLDAWVRGQRAQVFALIETPGREPEPVLQPLNDPDDPVIAILLTEQPGATMDELVLIPAPGTGQVSYAPEASGEYTPVEPAPGLDGIVLISREPGAQDDRLQVLDGNGDLDRPTFEGPVSNLLCGENGCG